MNSPEQSQTHEPTIRAFFDAMNAHDADAAVALTREDVVIAFGPNEFQGTRRFASSPCRSTSS